MERLQVFKLESEATFFFGITLNKAIFMLFFASIAMKSVQSISEILGFLVGAITAFLAYHIHNIFKKIFPGKRFEFIMTFFTQADHYIPRQDTVTIPVKVNQEI